MRLALKITVIVVIAFAVMDMARTQLRVQRRLREAEADARENQQLLLSALAPATARTFRVEGAAAALYEVGYAHRHQQRRRLRMVQLDGEGAEGPAVARERVGVSEAHPIASHVVEDGAGKRVLHTYAWVPTGLEAGPRYALEVSERLPARAQLQARLLREEATAVGARALAAALLVLLIGGLLVGRPLTRLVDHIERVGAGDLQARVSVAQRDELGTLADALNRMTARLARSSEQLRTEHEARMDALNQLRHSERLATIGKLAAGLAHELGTPLNVIKGRAQIIENEGTDPDAVVHLRSIQKQVDRMTRLMRGLLDFSRAGSSEAERRKELDLKEVVTEAMLLVQLAAKKRRVELRTVGDPGIVVFGAEGPLEQVLTNLIMNALDVSEAGTTVEIGWDLADDGRVRLWVADQGCGIPEDQLERLFEPFFTTKSAQEGTGLGLAIVDGIVKDHDGTIDVESSPGEGTRFVIHLPGRAPADAAGPASEG